MSRSYKHCPSYKDKETSRWGKKQANRKVRRTKNVPQGGGYKKLTNRWDIREFRYHVSWNQYANERENPSYRKWYTRYKMK